MFEIWCALITPFDDDLQIDFKALSDIIDHLLNEKIDGLVILGTTAETPTLSNDERWMLYNYITRYVNKRVPVYAGVGTNDTSTSLLYLKMASEAHVDGLLIVTPYYNCPTQEGLYQHFAYLAKHTQLPIILYNVKKRCGVELEPKTIINLCKKYNNIIGLKHSGANYDSYLRIKKEILNFKLFSGDDNALINAKKLEYNGIVSVAAHLYLPLMRKIVNEFEMLDELDLEKYKEICRLIYLETSPVPIKFALKLKKYCEDYVRMPLIKLKKASKSEIEEFLNKV